MFDIYLSALATLGISLAVQRKLQNRKTRKKNQNG